MKIAVYAITSVIPVVLAILLDRDLSSMAHLPVIGVAGISVSLCDALCGQIISNTRWIPFSACHAPAEAQQLARMFRRFHRDMIAKWMVAKLASAAVVILTAVMAIQRCPEFILEHRFWFFLVGYLLLGLSMCMAVSFLLSYFSAMEASDKEKLQEMNHAYMREHKEYFSSETEYVKKQLEGFGCGYTSSPSTAETVH